MKLISYAQNQEDVLLQKVFTGIRKGFYIDVGAFHPTTDSVTNVFYQRGWHGINIEPIKESFDKFIEARPRDINLNIAASTQSGLTKIYFGDNLGLASLELDQQLTESAMNSQEIKTDTLDNIIEQVPNLTDIHFLKIDVEGHEKAVLMGIDFRKHKPWVLIIESVNEFSPLDNANDWEELIPNEFYKFVYFDGLNNFYLHFEHLDLEKYFNRLSVIVPGYVSSSEFELSRKLNEEISKVVSLERNFSLEKRYTSELIIKISQLETRISWLQNEQKYQGLVDTLYHLQERVEYLSQIHATLLEE
jgi:FkbM family methyltransferase